jgi:type IV secretory pathway VirB2 component (pilin)
LWVEVIERRPQCQSQWLLPLLSFALLCLVQQDVPKADIAFSEFYEGPVYTIGQSISRGNIAKGLAIFTSY